MISDELLSRDSLEHDEWTMQAQPQGRRHLLGPGQRRYRFTELAGHDRRQP